MQKTSATSWLNLVGISWLATSLLACNSGANESKSPPPSGGDVASPHQSVQNGTPVTDPALNSRIPLLLIHMAEGSALCSATLLDTQTVLTAAHCALNMPAKNAGEVYTKAQLIAPQQIQVLLTKDLTKPLNYSQDSKTKNWNSYPVQAIYVHPDAFKGA